MAEKKPGSKTRTASGGIRRAVRKGLKAKAAEVKKGSSSATKESLEKRVSALERRLDSKGGEGKPESSKDKMARLRAMRKGAKK